MLRVEAASPPQVVARVRKYALCCCLNSMSLGYIVGVISVISPLVREGCHLTVTELLLWQAAVSAFAVPGAFLTPSIAAYGGRRLTFITSAAMFMTGCVISATATTFGAIFVGSLLNGVGLGIGFAVDPIYLGEISPPAIRGYFVTWSEIAVCMGQLLGFLVGLIFEVSIKTNSVVWRLTALTGVIIPSTLIYAVVFILPESPRWLVVQGRSDEARRVFTEHILVSAPEADALIKEIEADAAHAKIADDDQSMIMFLQTPKNPVVVQMMVIGIGLAVVQPFSGIDAILYNLTEALTYLGVRHLSVRYTILVVVGVAKLGAALYAASVLDMVGRRVLLLVSLAGTVVACALTALCLGFGSKDAGAATLGTLCLVALVFFFEIGLGPVCWLVPTEIFHNTIRTRAVALATILNRSMSTTVVLTAIAIRTVFSWAGFFTWLACCNVLSLAFVALYVPETANKSLEDMYTFVEASIIGRAPASGAPAPAGGHSSTKNPLSSTLLAPNSPADKASSYGTYA